MPLTPGYRLGPYEMRELLGSGGMGEVYRARDSDLNRSLAIKVLHPCLLPEHPAEGGFHRARSYAGSGGGQDCLCMGFCNLSGAISKWEARS